MRSAICLVIGIAVGAAMQPTVGQQREVIGLNHVAIAVPDFNAASRFYSEGMDSPQALAFKEASGSPGLSYFQIHRNTFIELMPVTPERPAGFGHFGLEVTELDGLVKRLCAAGMEVRDPVVSSPTKSRIAVAWAPQGTGVELLELGPDSLHRKVMDAWK